LELVTLYDHSRERVFANLALKLVEIIGFDYSYNFLLHFTIDPLFQTLDMNKSAIAFTLAWGN
jgi:hypothetical protein